MFKRRIVFRGRGVVKCRECGKSVWQDESTCEYCGCSNPGA